MVFPCTGQGNSDTESEGLSEDQINFANLKNDQLNKSYGFNSEGNKEDTLQNDEELIEKNSFSEEELITAVQKNNEINESLGFSSEEGSATPMANRCDEDENSGHFSDTSLKEYYSPNLNFCQPYCSTVRCRCFNTSRGD